MRALATGHLSQPPTHDAISTAATQHHWHWLPVGAAIVRLMRQQERAVSPRLRVPSRTSRKRGPSIEAASALDERVERLAAGEAQTMRLSAGEQSAQRLDVWLDEAKGRRRDETPKSSGDGAARPAPTRRGHPAAIARRTRRPGISSSAALGAGLGLGAAADVAMDVTAPARAASAKRVSRWPRLGNGRSRGRRQKRRAPARSMRSDSWMMPPVERADGRAARPPMEVADAHPGGRVMGGDALGCRCHKTSRRWKRSCRAVARLARGGRAAGPVLTAATPAAATSRSATGCGGPRRSWSRGGGARAVRWPIWPGAQRCGPGGRRRPAAE